MSQYDEVEVLVTYEGKWIGGYEVAAAAHEGDDAFFWVRRQSDGVELPARLPATRIRPANSEQHPPVAAIKQ